MDFSSMTREELINHIKELEDYNDNVIVFWGGKKELRETLTQVMENKDGDYTQEEVDNASVILKMEGAFETLIELLRESFDHGGINYVLSEKISAIMQEVADRYRKGIGPVN